MRVPLIGSYNTGPIANTDTQMLVNYYQELDNLENRTPRYAIPVPGISTYYTIPAESGFVSAMHYFNGLLYVVCTTGNLYSITLGNSPSSTLLATLSGYSGLAAQAGRIIDNGATNGNQLWITDGANAWVYKVGTGVQSLLGYPTGGVQSITIQDTFGIFSVPNSTQFWLTNPFNFRLVTTTNFAQPESILDQIQAVISDNTRLYIFGLTGLEVWYDSGDPNFPFTLIPGARYPIGCIAPGSVQRIDNSIVWFGNNEWGEPSFFQMRGENPPVRISTPQLDYVMSSFNLSGTGTPPHITSNADCYAYTYKAWGHEFYVANMGSGGGGLGIATMVWDASTGLWHRRQSSDGTEPYAGLTHAFVPAGAGTSSEGGHFFGSAGEIAKIGVMEIGTASDFGHTTTRIIISPHLNDEDERLFIRDVQVIGSFGTALGNVGGTMTLSYSKDNGVTFPSSLTYTFTANTKQRAIFRRLGWARDWVFKLTTTSTAIIVDFYAHTRERSNEDVQPGKAVDSH